MQDRQQQVRSFAARHQVVTGKRKGSAIRGLVLFLFGTVAVLLLIFWIKQFSQLQNRETKQVQVDASPQSLSMRGTVGAVDRKDPVEQPALLLFTNGACKGEPAVTLTENSTLSSEKTISICEYDNLGLKSMRLVGGSEVDFYNSCSARPKYGFLYVGSLFRSEGCVGIYRYPLVRSFKFLQESSLEKKQIPDEVLEKQWAKQDHRPTKLASERPKVRIVFSCESSEYFSYQVWANYYGFLTSGQKSASWTRLLTASGRDDLSDLNEGLATFQAKRTLYSRRYSPINKPDVIAKWFDSSDRPEEEIIAVIDPDNWLLRDISPYVDRVRKGEAIGEPAYYFGSKSAQRLWKELCMNNCERDLDLVGVPYILHRDDLAVIAPLWRTYTIMIKDLADKDETFKQKYGHLDVNWAAEMFAYNMASAHAGVRHEPVRKIQVRDVDSEHRKEKLEMVSMLHVGRAWFPKDYAPAQRWAHTEGKSFSHFGQQVWCKCNYTASTVIPWPVPPEADFQSTKTLELLHNSFARFGPIPTNVKFRDGPSHHGYGQSMD